MLRINGASAARPLHRDAAALSGLPPSPGGRVGTRQEAAPVRPMDTTGDAGRPPARAQDPAWTLLSTPVLLLGTGSD